MKQTDNQQPTRSLSSAHGFTEYFREQRERARQEARQGSARRRRTRDLALGCLAVAVFVLLPSWKRQSALDTPSGQQGPISAASVTSGPAPERWRPVTVTTYGPGYHGRKTASGEVYDRAKATMAVPPSRFRAMRGTYQTLKFRHPSTQRERRAKVWVNDVCPAGTYDLSDAAMTTLLGRYESTKVRALILEN